MKYLNNSFLQNIPTISIFFKKYELDNFKLKYSRRILSAAENRTAGGRCPNQMLGGGVGTDRASGGTDSDLGRWPRCPESASRRTSYGFTFCNVSYFKDLRCFKIT